MSSFFFLFIATLIPSIAFAEFVEDGNSPYQQGIILNKNNPFGGPSVETLIEETTAILNDDVAAIDDVVITARNGFGTPMAARVVFTPVVTPKSLDNVQWEEVELPNCMFGDIFDDSRDLIRFAKMADKALFYFDITSQNGFGKPCSAKLGFVRNRDSR